MHTHYEYNSVMIVDDEILALDHLAGLFDWNASNYRLVARANNAREAILLFSKKKATIIIADIAMPEMNGIAMMTKILVFNIPVRFIFLTAFREFHLIQNAMRLGASGFILKHELNAELLKQELAKAARELNSDLHKNAAAQNDAKPSRANEEDKLLLAVIEPDMFYPVIGAARNTRCPLPMEQIRRIDFSEYKCIDYAQIIDSSENRCLLQLNINEVYSERAFMEELQRFYAHVRIVFHSFADTSYSLASLNRPIPPRELPTHIEKLHGLLNQRFLWQR